MRRGFAFSLLLLCGCASQVRKPAAPVYEDPFVRLYNASPQARIANALILTGDYAEFRKRVDAPTVSAGVPFDHPFQVKGPVALTISENSQAFIHYLDAYGLEAQYLVNRVVGLLRLRIPSVVLLDDLVSAQRSHIATTILIDMQAAFASGLQDQSRLEVSYFFFDEHMNPVTRYLATAERAGKNPLDEAAYHQLSDRVIQDLNSKLNVLLGPKAK